MRDGGIRGQEQDGKEATDPQTYTTLACTNREVQMAGNPEAGGGSQTSPPASNGAKARGLLLLFWNTLRSDSSPSTPSVPQWRTVMM